MSNVFPAIPSATGPTATLQVTVGGQSGEETAEQTCVLVADGNATVRKILRHTLSAIGWEVIEAENGVDALRLAGSRPMPHAILLDVNLAKMNGYDLCRHLKRHATFRLIPIVMMTPAESHEVIEQAAKAGADEFLSKPINRAELTVRLRSLARMHRFSQELIGAESVALALARAVASKDGYSGAHVEEVANCAVAFGESLGLEAAELKILKYGAILHNVGKIAIPDAVLEKTGGLTPRERALFQQHPRVGCDICAPLKPLKSILPIIRHHKEYWDGTGYPDGLRGDAIPLGAQIVGIIDVYSAMTHDRPFRQAKSEQEAIAHLSDLACHGKYNPDLVNKFIAWCATLNATHTQAIALATDETVPGK